MAKIQKNAAMFDLFDNGSNSQPGERQTDIEDIIAEKSCGSNRGMKLCRRADDASKGTGEARQIQGSRF